MAEEIHIPHWVLVQIHYLSQGNRSMNTLSYSSIPDLTSGAQLSDLCASIWSRITPGWAAAHGAGYVMTHITAKTMYPEVLNYEGGYTPVAALPGSMGGELMPGSVASAIFYDSAYRGRSSHGRQFMGGFTEGQVGGDFIVNSLVTWLAQWAANMLTFEAVDDVNLIPVIASRKQEVLYPMVRAVTENIVDNMRRRLTGRGE